MVEPLFIRGFDVPPQVGELVELSGAEAKHAIAVRRMRVGEAIQLSNGMGLRVRGSIDSIEGPVLKVRATEVSQEIEPNLSITLVQALAKGDRDELAVQAATELGASAVIPWQAERSISRWDGPKVAKGVERWQTIATEAAKQALRATHPLVHQPVTTKQLAALSGSFDLLLVLDPTSPVGLTSLQIPEAATIAIVVGPEGGISAAELADLQGAGGKLVHLGGSILRTSTAGLAAISALQAMSGNWGNA